MELRHVMMNLGEKMSEEECDALVDVSALGLLFIACKSILNLGPLGTFSPSSTE